MIREIADRLEKVYGQGEGRAIASLIAQEATGLNVGKIIMKGLKLSDVPKAVEMTERALTSEPIQHIIGWTMFCGNKIKCDRRALVPRPETEVMTINIMEDENAEGLEVIDIGTGSGCIATALANRWRVTAMEKSEEALSLARENFLANNVDVRLVKDDILSPTQDYGQFDIIVSNPPYIRPSEKATMEDNVLRYEPEIALFVTEKEPLVFYKAIAAFGSKHLKNGGRFYVEINRDLGEATAEVFRSLGYIDVEVKRDIFGNNRVVSGKWTRRY
ncbi:MAG: peptide chain release factor N(5)-glutamine methyltransferase [Paludibacteraceae bacterium]|nr:peptide chain release factor N(5)-glutamine methyltransferase [Paludibacteraceae bacterium]